MIRSRRILAFHHPDLDRAGLRAEQPPVGQVERVEDIARRMIGGRVQRVEVVVDRIEVGTIRHHEAQATEDGHRLVHDPGHGMDSAHAALAPGQGHVDGVGRDGRALDAVRGLVQRFLQSLLDLVQCLAGIGPLLGRHRSHALHQRRQGALASDKSDPALLHGRLVGGFRQQASGLVQEMQQIRLQFVHREVLTLAPDSAYRTRLGRIHTNSLSGAVFQFPKIWSAVDAAPPRGSPVAPVRRPGAGVPAQLRALPRTPGR